MEIRDNVSLLSIKDIDDISHYSFNSNIAEYNDFLEIAEKFYDLNISKTVKPHFIPDDFCKLFQSKSPVIKCGNDNDSKLFQS